MRARILALGSLLAVGCTATDPVEVPEDFGGLASEASGGKADHNGAQIVGSLDYDQTSAAVAYTNPPRYRVFKFAADQGDQIDVRVTSTNGDAMVWILDDSFASLAFNDDATASTLNARVQLAIPAHASRTHYIVFRDYDSQPATFRVRLDGEAAGCARDADCAMVEAGCCDVGDWVAVPNSSLEAFEDAKACTGNEVCPARPIVFRGEQALCNVDSHECEVALPSQVACGGRTINPHHCPDGWQCVGPGLVFDATGTCAQTCGGFANLPCPTGLACVDDPNDDCSVATGGADCGGICQ